MERQSKVLFDRATTDLPEVEIKSVTIKDSYNYTKPGHSYEVLIFFNDTNLSGYGSTIEEAYTYFMDWIKIEIQTMANNI